MYTDIIRHTKRVKNIKFTGTFLGNLKLLLEPVLQNTVEPHISESQSHVGYLKCLLAVLDIKSVNFLPYDIAYDID